MTKNNNIVVELITTTLCGEARGHPHVARWWWGVRWLTCACRRDRIRYACGLLRGPIWWWQCVTRTTKGFFYCCGLLFHIIKHARIFAVTFNFLCKHTQTTEKNIFRKKIVCFPLKTRRNNNARVLAQKHVICPSQKVQ